MTYKKWTELVQKANKMFDEIGKPYFKSGFLERIAYSKEGPEQIQNLYPSGYKGKTLDGIQLVISHYRGKTIYEVSEHMAGPKKNELHVFKTYKSARPAIKLIRKIAETKRKPRPAEIWK